MTDRSTLVEAKTQDSHEELGRKGFKLRHRFPDLQWQYNRLWDWKPFQIIKGLKG
jgi:hypothetical protein